MRHRTSGPLSLLKLAAAAAVFMLSFSAFAQDLGSINAYSSIDLALNGRSGVSVGSFAPGTITGTSAYEGTTIGAIVSRFYSPIPNLSAQSSGFKGHSNAYGFSNYRMVVRGPDALPVPILLFAESDVATSGSIFGNGSLEYRAGTTLRVSITESGQVANEIYYQNANGRMVTVTDQGTSETRIAINTFQNVTPFILTTNGIVNIGANATTYANVPPAILGFPQTDAGWAVAANSRQYFAIDPSFARANEYWLEFTPGIGNPSSVPEPAMLLPLLTASMLLKRRNRRRV